MWSKLRWPAWHQQILVKNLKPNHNAARTVLTRDVSRQLLQNLQHILTDSGQTPIFGENPVFCWWKSHVCWSKSPRFSHLSRKGDIGQSWFSVHSWKNYLLVHGSHPEMFLDLQVGGWKLQIFVLSSVVQKSHMILLGIQIRLQPSSNIVETIAWFPLGTHYTSWLKNMSLLWRIIIPSKNASLSPSTLTNQPGYF